MLINSFLYQLSKEINIFLIFQDLVSLMKSHHSGSVLSHHNQVVNYYNAVVQLTNFTTLLTLKAPNKNCSRRHFNFLLLSFKKNKA